MTVNKINRMMVDKSYELDHTKLLDFDVSRFLDNAVNEVYGGALSWFDDEMWDEFLWEAINL